MSGSRGLAFGRWEEPAHIVPARELPVFMETASLKMKTGSGLKKESRLAPKEFAFRSHCVGVLFCWIGEKETAKFAPLKFMRKCIWTQGLRLAASEPMHTSDRVWFIRRTRKG